MKEGWYWRKGCCWDTWTPAFCRYSNETGIDDPGGILKLGLGCINLLSWHLLQIFLNEKFRFLQPGQTQSPTLSVSGFFTYYYSYKPRLSPSPWLVVPVAPSLFNDRVSICMAIVFWMFMLFSLLLLFGHSKDYCAMGLPSSDWLTYSGKYAPS